MRKLHNKAMLLLAIAANVVLLPSCDKDETFDCEDLYFVTTNSIADYYFKPKKLNITSKNDCIYGDWFANENIGKQSESSRDGLDINQEHADHYYFLDKSATKKYVDLKNDTGEEVFIDDNDIISPFKEYAVSLGDTLLSCRHNEQSGIGERNICVLPITGIDVMCDKDFDSQHPVGSNLNDIMCWFDLPNYYGMLHEVIANSDMEYHYAEHSYHIPLSSISDHPLMMTGNEFSLEFNSQPAEPGTYEFTVKFTFGPDPLSGEIVDVPSAKVSMDFAAD